MNTRSYLLISGTVFGVVSVLHLLRALMRGPFEIGPVSLPIWASWIGFVVAGLMSAWAFRLVRDGQ